MDREEKIKVIYKEMANKELAMWCDIIAEGDMATIVDANRFREWIAILRGNWFVTREEPNYEFTVIWCPVMIWDVISYLRKPFDTFVEGMPVGRSWEVDSYIKNINSLLTEWIDTRSPIEQQSDECINFVYSLILDS